MSEIADVVQIIRVEFEGMQLAMKVGSASIKTMQKAVKFLMGMLIHEKSKGKTALKKLLLRGGDLQVLEFQERDLKDIEKMCKKYGILYSLVPKLDAESATREILFHAEAVPRVNMLLEKMKNPEGAQVKSMDTFLNETDDTKLNAFGEYLKDEAKENPKDHADANLESLIDKVGKYALEKRSTSVDEIVNDLSIDKKDAEKALSQLTKIGAVSTPDEAGRITALMKPEDLEEKMKRLSSLTQRMRQVAAEKDASLADITISKKLVEKETPTQILTRIPGTWGPDSRYLWIDKTDVISIHGGKTLLSFLDKNQSYPLYDKAGTQMGMIRGIDLFRTHYSSVDKSVRKKYEKTIKAPTIDKMKVR